MKRNIVKKIISVGLTASILTVPAVSCLAEEKDQVTIRFYSTLGEAEPGYKPMMEILDKFEKDNPDIKVELELQSSSQYHEKLVSEIAADTLANVFMHWGGAEMYEAVLSGKVMDLTELMDSEPEFKAQFSDAVMNATNVRYTDIDGLFGVPLSSVSGGFYYNKALFEKAGITETPATWEELLEDVEKLKEIDVIPWALGAKDGWRAEHLYSAIFLRENGVEGAMKLAERTMKYSDPEAISAWGKIEQLVEMGAFGPEPASVDFSNEMTMFSTGKAAMNFSLSAYTETYGGEECEVGEDIEFFNMPVIDGKEEYAKNNFGGGDIALGIATNATNEQIEASWKLCKAFCGVEGQTVIANANALIPTNTQIQMDPDKVSRLFEDFASVVNDADALLTDVTNYDNVSTLLTKSRDVATALVNGQLTPEEAGQELDAEIELYSE